MKAAKSEYKECLRYCYYVNIHMVSKKIVAVKLSQSRYRNQCVTVDPNNSVLTTYMALRGFKKPLNILRGYMLQEMLQHMCLLQMWANDTWEYYHARIS